MCESVFTVLMLVKGERLLLNPWGAATRLTPTPVITGGVLRFAMANGMCYTAES